MSIDDKRKSGEYGDSSHLTNWILYSGATFHMTPEVTDFIPGALEDTDKFIEVADGHHIVEEHRSLGGSIISRLDNGAFVGLIYELLVFS